MKTVTSTEFRKHASSLFSDVQEGEIIHVLCHGRPIAEISPLHSEEKKGAFLEKARIKAIN
ncbi:type II toxin-antitoxin system Phd/YefM family antitoxin [Dehalococcoidia bacterium]|nr:type II toxin-antitoxin system Phd/YefM family antitoxin [Dehalococcoidia bacterium]